MVLLMISTRMGAPQVALRTSPARYLSAKFPLHRRLGFSMQMRQAMSGHPWFLHAQVDLSALVSQTRVADTMPAAKHYDIELMLVSRGAIKASQASRSLACEEQRTGRRLTGSHDGTQAATLLLQVCWGLNLPSPGVPSPWPE